MKNIFPDACVQWFRDYADSKLAIDKAFAELPAEDRSRMAAELAVLSMKQPGKAGLVASEYIVNSYLSGPGTIAANALSAVTQGVIQPLVRSVEAMVPGSQKRAGEGLVMLRSIMQGVQEALAFANSGFVNGHPLDIRISPKAFGKEYDKVMSGIKVNPDKEEMMKAHLYDYTQRQIPGTVGDIVRMPTRIGIWIDEFNKAILRRMEYNAIAYRRAWQISKQTGQNEADVFKRLTQERFTTENWQEKITSNLDANDLWEVQNFAKEAVFQGKLTGFAADVAKARAEHPWLVLVTPFVKTPVNILKEGISFIPGLGLGIKKEIGNSGKFDFAFNIPEKRDNIIAKQALGLGFGIMLDNMVANGLITGSQPEEGRPAFSIKIGDTWYQYSRIEPLATVFGMAADAHRIVQDYKDNKNPDKKATDYLKAYASSVRDNIFNKSFMEGLAKASLAMTDPERYGGGFLNQYANALVPTLSATVGKMTDQYERQSDTFVERMQARVPGLREELPIRYSKTGEPEQTSMLQALTGIKDYKPTTIETKLAEIGLELDGARSTLRGVELNNQQLAEYKKDSGELFSGILKELFSDSTFNNLSKPEKEVVIKRMLSRARRAAANQLIARERERDPVLARQLYNNLIERKGLQEVMGYQQ